MHRTSHRPLRPTRGRISLARRLSTGATLLAVAGSLLVGASPATAATVPSGPPVGNVDNVNAVTGGLRVRGWAADADTTAALTVKITVAGTTHQVKTGVTRLDVPKVFPQFSTTTGFETVIPLPTGTHQVCVTAVNVGAGSDKVFPCRTATVTVGTPTTSTPTTSTPTTSTPTTTTTTTTTAPRTLSWAPPALTNPTTIAVSATNRDLRLAAGQDYVITMPSTPLDVVGGLKISGGRNVVLIGGEIKISRTSTTGTDLRGLYLKSQTGTVHIEGLKITGGALGEGINLDQRYGATVQLQNIRVDTVHGSYSGHHADVLQTWAGPKVLRIDGLTGYTTYQGFFLLPRQFGDVVPTVFDLRNVNIVGQTGSKYLFWRDSGTWPIKTQNVWAHTSQTGAPRHQFLWGAWPAVLEGKPTTGDIVPADRAGLRYVSPGYTR